MVSDRLHLLHCEERLRSIQRYCGGGRAAFMASRLHQDAVLWNLHTICAIGRRISDEEKQKHTHVDWHALCNLCEGLFDGDMTADAERVWKTIETPVAILQHQLRLVLTAKA